MTCGLFTYEATEVQFQLVAQSVGDGFRYWAEDSGMPLETEGAPEDGYGWPTLQEAFFDAIRWALLHHLRYGGPGEFSVGMRRDG